MRFIKLLPIAPVALSLLACSSSSETDQGEDQYSSNQAKLLTFEFDAQVTVDQLGFGSNEDLIQDQLLYTIGHLNGDRAVGRLDNVKFTNVKETAAGNVKTLSYHAVLPVSWGSKTNLPKKYSFRLPKDVSSSGREAFTKKYMHDCVDFGAHEVTSSSMWYYYRPNSGSCKVDPADVVAFDAKVTVSKENTSGKYPEYDKVWEDNSLNVVAVFGKFKSGEKAGDAGIDGYKNFLASISSEFKKFSLTSTPKVLPANPIEAPDVEFQASLQVEKKIKVNALLVDEVSSAGADFYNRYEGLSTDADIISYNGHAGLGQNVRALTRHGKFKAKKYVIVFMNGCDTFAYVDGSLADARRQLNPDDPKGTKYMEFVTNTMPAFFSSMPGASMQLIRGLAAFDKPLTYDKIFESVDNSQIIVVTGEEDNTYTPKK